MSNLAELMEAEKIARETWMEYFTPEARASLRALEKAKKALRLAAGTRTVREARTAANGRGSDLV